MEGWEKHDLTTYPNRILNKVGGSEIRDTQHSDVTDSQGTEQLRIANRSKCGEMHHQNHQCSLSDKQRICCHRLRGHHGGFEYDSSRQQQKEDSNVPVAQEYPTVSCYTGKA